MDNYVNESNSKRHNLFVLLTFLFIVYLLSACQSVRKEIVTDSSSDKLLAITTFTILADMARIVSGDLIEVGSITKFGAEIHGLNLSLDIDNNILKEVKNAFHENIVLLFRKQSLTPEKLIK